MFQLINQTRFAASLLPSVESDGTECMGVVIKATYLAARNGASRIADELVPIFLTDVYWGEAGASSLRYASDAVPRKTGTDVVLSGSAHAPRRETRSVDVTLEAGSLRRTVRVFGDRVWKTALGISTAPSEPLPFDSMPLVYERAFGGTDKSHSDPAKWDAERRNPVGRGFFAAGSRRDAAGAPVPNLEDPAGPIRSIRDRPSPAGFGFLAPNWSPRREFTGTFDQAWLEKRFPLLPPDFDARFYNCASPGLTSSEFFKGGEAVRTTNASPDGVFAFRLPETRLTADYYFDGSHQTVVCDLDTVVLEPDKSRFLIAWRSLVRCHRKTKYFRAVKIRAQGEPR